MANDDDNLRQWEAMARQLDGQDQPLDARQREIVDSIREDLAAVGRSLDVEIPAQALERVRRRMRAEAVRPTRFRVYAAVGGAAAAAIVLAVALSHKPVNTADKNIAASNNSTKVEPAQAGAPLNDLVRQISQNPSEMMDLMSTMTLDQDQLATLKVSHDQALTYLDDME